MRSTKPRTLKPQPKWLDGDLALALSAEPPFQKADDSSVSMAEMVSMAGVTTRVEDGEWKVDCSPLHLVPDDKKASSDTEAADSERTGSAREQPALGGGVTIISRRSVGHSTQ